MSKRCRHSTGCDTRPNFGKPGSKLAEYCSKHAPVGYVDVKNKKCQYPTGCDVQPNFGKSGSKLAEYCSKHAPAGYVDVMNKRCQHPAGCDKIPNFGKPGSKLAEYCSKHAPVGHVDVKSKKCQYADECDTQPKFGKPGYPSEFCSKHKERGMIIYPMKYKKDEIFECEYCSAEIHYNDDFCKSCKRYNTLGMTVGLHNKELAITNLLEENFDPEIFKHDKTVLGGCSMKRPDFLIVTEWGNIVLEVDENQHNRKTYPCECEVSRMKEIYFDCGVNHLLFIRYNPDKYITLDNERMFSSSKRREFLVKFRRDHIKERMFDHLGVVYLFYDGFARTVVPEIEEIDPYKNSDVKLKG